jgi:hypothetical protein
MEKRFSSPLRHTEVCVNVQALALYLQCSPNTAVTIMLLHNLAHNFARRARPLAARRLLHATAPAATDSDTTCAIHNTSEFLNERELGFMANELVSRQGHGGHGDG